MPRGPFTLIVALVFAAHAGGVLAQNPPAAPPPAAPAPAAAATQAASPEAAASAQQPAPAAAGQTDPGAVSPAEKPQGFTYLAEGRRDPFVSLLRRGGDAVTPGGNRAAGLAGLAVSEVSLRGTMRGQDGFIGMLLGVDQKTYLVRTGDRLLDGTVQAVTQDAVLIRQQVNDPLSLEKQRDVRKTLRQTEANQ